MMTLRYLALGGVWLICFCYATATVDCLLNGNWLALPFQVALTHVTYRWADSILYRIHELKQK